MDISHQLWLVNIFLAQSGFATILKKYVVTDAPYPDEVREVAAEAFEALPEI